jgi:hypothetical protein
LREKLRKGWNIGEKEEMVTKKVEV